MQNPLKKYFEENPERKKTDLSRATGASKTTITLICQDDRRPSAELAAKIARWANQPGMIAYWYPNLASLIEEALASQDSTDTKQMEQV